MYIERKRYVVCRYCDGAIMCGLARNYVFKQPNEIGDTAIKTYSSEKKALTAARLSFGYDETKVYAFEVTETIS